MLLFLFFHVPTPMFLVLHYMPTLSRLLCCYSPSSRYLKHPLHLLAWANSSSVMLQLNVTSFLWPPFSASLGRKDLWLSSPCLDYTGPMHISVTALVTLCYISACLSLAWHRARLEE